MEQIKGRPPKPVEKQKRLHFSVWVTEKEKKTIEELAFQAGLPVSQFFLTQIINKPIKTPRKKAWPKSLEPYAGAISKLSGLLSLLAIKTKDKDMQQSTDWRITAECVKWLNKLILMRVFQDFEFPELKKSILTIEQKLKLIYWQLNSIGHFEEQAEMLTQLSHVNKLAQTLLASFEKQYIDEVTPSAFEQFWSAEMNIHQEIKKIKNELLKL
jgi:hypothetical protein